MTVAYHGTPITPQAELLTLAGRCFCVSYFNRAKTSMPLIEGIASALMLDNGAFSAWRTGVEFTDEYWGGYHAWVDPLLDRPTTWAVIPDAIAMPSQEQDRLLKLWPHGDRGAPVFHLTEDFMPPLSRLLRLLDEWPRVCIGWAHDPRTHPISGDAFERAMDVTWNEIARRHARTPNVHMFRGMQLVRCRWPFASVDSTDVGRNHNRPQNTALKMAARWDAAQCPARWEVRPLQQELAA
jgi:hypothetical protein